jgi:hypothetical protein
MGASEEIGRDQETRAFRTELQEFKRGRIKTPGVRRLRIDFKRPLKSRIAVVVGLLTGERFFLQKEAPRTSPCFLAA